MTFDIRAFGAITQQQAEQEIQTARAYLSHSALADGILQELDDPQTPVVRIYVSRDHPSVYYMPGRGDPDGGIVWWNPTHESAVVDRTAHRPARADYGAAGPPRGDLQERQTPAMDLIHELTHALQYLTETRRMRAIDRRWFFRERRRIRDTEQTNVQAVEATVAMELKRAGFTEGVRWDYYDTA